ncbi:hypothetical protein HK100_007858, partial [Physocladia obscura]
MFVTLTLARHVLGALVTGFAAFILIRMLLALVTALAATLPVYFHILVLVCLGIYGWAANMHLLSLAGINPNRLLQAQPLFESQLHLSAPFSLASAHLIIVPANIYKLAVIYSVVSIVSIILFLLLIRLLASEESAEIAPLFGYLVSLLILYLPGDIFFLKERRAFLGIAFGGLTSTVPFCDVILADILTSFSKVLGDLHLVAQDLLSHQSSHDARYSENNPSENKGSQQSSPTSHVSGRIMEFIAEYYQTTNNPAAQTRHLMNALKYCTAFPVIAASWLINWVRAELSFVSAASTINDGAENVGATAIHSKFIGSFVVTEANKKIDDSKVEFLLNFAIGIWYFS